MDITMRIKPLFDEEKKQIGLVATAIIDKPITPVQKIHIENRLKEAAYANGKGINVYHQDYPNTIGIVVIGDIDNLPSFPPFAISV